MTGWLWLLACTGDPPVTGDSGTTPPATDSESTDTGSPTDDRTAEELCALAGEDLDVLVRDGFARADSSELGTTEVGGVSYIGASAAGTDYARVVDEALVLHYFADSAGSAPDQWVDLGRLQIADAVIDLGLATYSDDYDTWVSVSWRLPEQANHRNAPGYHAVVEHGFVRLYAGRQLLDEAELADDHALHPWRIVTVGDAHCVYKDHALVLSARDDTWTRPGHVGVGAWYSLATFDDWTVSRFPGASSDGRAAFDLWHDDPPSGELAEVDHFELQWQTGAGGQQSLHYRGAAGRAYTLDLGPDTVSLVWAGEVVADASFIPAEHTPDTWELVQTWRLEVAGQSHRLLRDGEVLFDLVHEGSADPGTLTLELPDRTASRLGLRHLEPPSIHPAGEVFPVVLYSVAADRLAEVPAGALVQTYGDGDTQLAYAEIATRHERASMTQVGTYYVDDEDPPEATTEEEVTRVVARRSALPAGGWWALPEELRYWRANELQELQDLYGWLRVHDPHQAPVFMYQPNHRTAAALAETVPWLDVIGKGAYTTYAGQPRAWIRYQLESTVESITLAGFQVGADHLSGDKLPLLVAGLWADNPGTAEELWHDVWSGIASGAQGVSLFSHHHGLDPASGDGLDGFVAAAELLLEGDAPLGPAILGGEPVPGLSVAITAGPTETEAFTPVDEPEPFQYGCVNLRGWDHDGQRLVVAVNSCTEAVSATLSGLGDTEAWTVLTEDREVTSAGGSISEDFAPLGVHLYRSALD